MSTPTQSQWQSRFAEVPGALGAVLQEIFAVVDAESAPRDKRVKAPARERTIDEVNDLLWPRFATVPFAEAIQPLLKPSMRALADRAGMSPSTLTRLIAGELPLDRFRLERIAAAAKVAPGHFLEYRQLVVAEEVTRALATNPAAGISVYKALANRAKP